MTTIAQALQQAVADLHEHGEARLEAEVLLAYALQKPRSYLHAWPEATLGREQEAHFVDLIRQRAAGLPVAYLTGHREFWSLDLEVTSDTLIPRPETELLVEQALALLPRHETIKLADLGTGSGAIALAVAHERPDWQLYAVDRSMACLKVARRNARRHGLAGIAFINADWSACFAEASLDAMLCNPPYVAEHDPHLHQGDVRFEPRSALAAGAHGLDDLKRLIDDAPRVLKGAGLLLLEHAPEQRESLHNLLNNNNFVDIYTSADLAGKARVTRARKKV